MLTECGSFGVLPCFSEAVGIGWRDWFTKFSEGGVDGVGFFIVWK